MSIMQIHNAKLVAYQIRNICKYFDFGLASVAFLAENTRLN